MSTDDADAATANEAGDGYGLLTPMEATDSDDVLNDDGDEVVDPPDDWSGVDKFGMSAQEQAQGESLDQRLAEEVPDITPDDIDLSDAVDVIGADEALPSSDFAAVDPGEHHGQIDGAPEDGDSLFPVVE
jgi:hypothetical protein